MSANAPSRASNNFVLSIGLVSITLDIYSGTEDSAIKRSTYFRHTVTETVEEEVEGGRLTLVEKPKLNDKGEPITELHPVGQTTYDKITGENLNKSDTIKVIECSDGSLVELPDEEIQGLLTQSNGAAEFVGFIKRGTFLENYVTEKLYQVRASRHVGGKSVKVSPYDKPLALFFKVMASKHLVGLVKLTARGTTRFYGLFPDGRMYSVFFADEVREDRPMPTGEFNPKELDLASKLIEQFTLTDAPEFNDETADAVRAYAEDKAKKLANGEQVVTPTPKTDDESTGDFDLSALLAGSIQ
jgi:non-homologous end joining protein Ku